jgi:hypothetical protein
MRGANDIFHMPAGKHEQANFGNRKIQYGSLPTFSKPHAGAGFRDFQIRLQIIVKRTIFRRDSYL